MNKIWTHFIFDLLVDAVSGIRALEDLFSFVPILGLVTVGFSS